MARPARKTRHLCTNIVMDIVDEGKARGESAVALFQPAEGPKMDSFQDVSVRTKTGWKFAERRGTLDF